MTRPELQKRVLEIVSARVGRAPDEIPMETPFDQLGFESMDTIEILYALEDELNLSIPPDKARAVDTVNKLIDTLEGELGS